MNGLDRLNFGWGRRLPLVLQIEAAECGLACLAMVADYFGHHTDLADLRRRFGLSLKGATLKDLTGVADRLGLAARALRLDLEELELVRTPAILHWDMNHFVVLKCVRRGGIVIHDPAVGVRRMDLREAARHVTGVALELSPTEAFEPAAAQPRLRMGRLLGRLVGLRRSLVQVLVLALTIEVFAMVMPLMMEWVVDHGLATADRELLATLVLGFALLLLVKTAFSAMRGWLLMVLSATLRVQARCNLFSHLVNLPASYFETRHLGDIMSRFGSQETILQAVTSDLVEALLDGVMAGLTLVIMLVTAPTLGAVVVAGAGLYALVRWVSYGPLRQASAEAIVWAARRDSHLLETLRGVRTIKLFNAQEDRRTRWLNLLVETINRQLDAQKLKLILRSCNAVLVGGLGILVIWLGAIAVLDGRLTVGVLFAFIAYKDQFLARISELVDKAVDLQMLRLHGERLADIALTPPEPRGAALEPAAARRAASIEMRGLGFRYSDHDRWVLDGVSCRIEAGESVAITGASGCGKTTLLKVLAGLLPATRGEILVDDLPLSRIGGEGYRSMIGVVMQDDQLFAGSIADNISFFAAIPDLPHIEDCARQAAIHDDIANMPMGYGTLIGDMGTVLSGGQKQRVLIARALYRQPAIMLLDEATSHLDSHRERLVNAAIASARVTRLIIAHREETIRSADRIITLDKGRVVAGAWPADKAISII